MPRVKRGAVRQKKRTRLLAKTKGYKWGRKKLVRLAKTAIKKAGVYAYRDRRNKKREIRRLWQIQINAGVRQYDLNYSKFTHLLKKNRIELDRKILSQLAREYPEIFAQVITKAKA